MNTQPLPTISHQKPPRRERLADWWNRNWDIACICFGAACGWGAGMIILRFELLRFIL